MRILTLVPGGIGDQILFFPTLADLKAKYPHSTIDVIVEPRAKAAYRVCPYVHDVFMFDYKDRNSMADYLNLLGVIRDREYELALSLGQRWTIGFLLWLNGIPARVGYKTDKSWFISNPAPLKTEQYAASMYHDLLLGLGIQTPCPPLKIDIPKADLDWATYELNNLEITENNYILIHGGSSQLAQEKGIDKIYPVEKWQKIIQELKNRQPSVPIVLLKGPEDEELINLITVGNNNLKISSPPDVGKLAAMISKASLMVCTDSGPMHLSVAVETKTIALFGPTEAKKLLPPDDNRYIGIQSSTGLISDIEPETVLQEIVSV